jgi:hypothetical protein
MSDKLDLAIQQAIGATLENMAFMEVCRDLTDAVRCPPEEIVGSRRLIHDPVQGEFYLLMPAALLGRISSSVYIVPEEDLSEQMQLDMIGELINTAAGLFMNAYLPKDRTYSLGLPENRVSAPEDPPCAMKQWDFQAENMVFSLVLAGDGFFA